MFWDQSDRQANIVQPDLILIKNKYATCGASDKYHNFRGYDTRNSIVVLLLISQLYIEVYIQWRT